jgi:hypothetical protein
MGELPTVTFFYDFPAVNASDPLLTCTPGRVSSRYNINLKQYSAALKLQ